MAPSPSKLSCQNQPSPLAGPPSPIRPQRTRLTQPKTTGTTGPEQSESERLARSLTVSHSLNLIASTGLTLPQRPLACREHGAARAGLESHSRSRRLNFKPKKTGDEIEAAQPAIGFSSPARWGQLAHQSLPADSAASIRNPGQEAWPRGWGRFKAASPARGSKGQPKAAISTDQFQGVGCDAFTRLKNRPKLSLNRETTCPRLGCAGPGV